VLLLAQLKPFVAEEDIRLAKGIARAKFSDRGQWRDVADFVGGFNHHQACGVSRIRYAGAVAWTPFVYCWNARPSPSVSYAQVVGVAL
jgi:hypothetical protein